MIYTVYKGVGLGIGVVARNLHDTAQGMTYHRLNPRGGVQFEVPLREDQDV